MKYTNIFQAQSNLRQHQRHIFKKLLPIIMKCTNILWILSNQRQYQRRKIIILVAQPKFYTRFVLLQTQFSTDFAHNIIINSLRLTYFRTVIFRGNSYLFNNKRKLVLNFIYKLIVSEDVAKKYFHTISEAGFKKKKMPVRVKMRC